MCCAGSSDPASAGGAAAAGAARFSEGGQGKPGRTGRENHLSAPKQPGSSLLLSHSSLVSRKEILKLYEMLPTLHAAAHLTGLNLKTAENSKEDVKKKCEILMC